MLLILVFTFCQNPYSCYTNSQFYLVTGQAIMKEIMVNDAANTNKCQ